MGYIRICVSVPIGAWAGLALGMVTKVGGAGEVGPAPSPRARPPAPVPDPSATSRVISDRSQGTEILFCCSWQIPF